MSLVRFRKEKLTTADIIYLSIFLAVVTAKLILKICSTPMVNCFYDLAIAVSNVAIITSSFANHFARARFSVAWGSLSLIYFFIAQRSLSLTLLVGFLLYLYIRQQFYNRFDREIIPPVMGKGYFIPVYDDANNIYSDEDDYNYMRLMVWILALMLGFALFFNGENLFTL